MDTLSQTPQVIQQPAVIENAAKIINQPADYVADFGRVYDLAQYISQADIIPDNYKRKPADCAIAIDMANRMGVSPLMVMQSLYVVKGRPSWSGQACKALIENCGKFKPGSVRHIYTGTKGTDNRGCYLVAVWADTGDRAEGPEVTMAMAKAEGWMANKGSMPSKWNTMPELMLAYRAAAFFARVYCPEVLMGIHVEGEAEDIAPADKAPRVEL